MGLATGTGTLRKILLTGAGGFIGSHLAEELVRRNFEVRAFVHYNALGSHGWLDASPADIRKELDVFAGDIRDPNGVRTAMKGCDAVLHLAALIAIPYSYHSPDTYVETNIRGTLNVLQAARDLDVSHVLHTSTSEVYGTAQFVPITEEHIAAGAVALFGQQDRRRSASAVVRAFVRYAGDGGAALQYLRPAAIGARGDPDHHHADRGRRSAPSSSAVSTRRAISISSLTRSAGFLAALETKAGVGEVINIGSGFEISIGDTARLIAELMDAEDRNRAGRRPASAGAQRSRPAVGQQRQGAKAARAGRRAWPASKGFARASSRRYPGSPRTKICPAIAPTPTICEPDEPFFSHCRPPRRA